MVSFIICLLPYIVHLGKTKCDRGKWEQKERIPKTLRVSEVEKLRASVRKQMSEVNPCITAILLSSEIDDLQGHSQVGELSNCSFYVVVDCCSCWFWNVFGSLGEFGQLVARCLIRFIGVHKVFVTPTLGQERDFWTLKASFRSSLWECRTERGRYHTHTAKFINPSLIISYPMQ